ncbi:MAG: iron-sulfur cluster assembly accessory protein [Methanomassiliicoccales archaeon]|jgi:iron-sulfur cluster assembly accessory protein
MVEVTTEASKYILDLIAKNDKTGAGIKIYLSGMGCSGPQFGMAFQVGAKEGDVEQKVDGFSLFYDNETKEVLDACTVDFIETPYGSGLIVHNPNVSGCSSCGGGCH